MSEKIFIEISNLLYPFVRKILLDLSPHIDLKKEVEDVLQESWKRLCETYPALLDNVEIIQPLIFVIAKHEAFQYRRKKQRFFLASAYFKTLYPPTIGENAYDLLIKQDLEIVLNLLPENYVFVWSKAMQYEPLYQQEEIIQMIKQEYEIRFNSKLSVENYRTIKRRTGKKIIHILSREEV